MEVTTQELVTEQTLLCLRRFTKCQSFQVNEFKHIISPALLQQHYISPAHFGQVVGD